MNSAYMLGDFMRMTWFSHCLLALPSAIKYLFFCIIQAICRFFLYLPELMFKIVTGTGTEWVWGASGENQTIIGGTTGNDIAMAFLRSSVVQTTFFTVLGFSVVLLVIFTVIALIRSEFTTDITKSAKGPYINRALKGIMHFILVPVLSLAFVLGVNTITRAVNKLFGASDNSLATSVFKVTLHGSMRDDEEFINYLRTNEYNKFATKTQGADILNNIIETHQFEYFCTGYEPFLGYTAYNYIQLDAISSWTWYYYCGDYANSIIIDFSNIDFKLYENTTKAKTKIAQTPVSGNLGKAKVKLKNSNDYTEWKTLKANYFKYAGMWYFEVYLEDEGGDLGGHTIYLNNWYSVFKTYRDYYYDYGDAGTVNTDNIFEGMTADEVKTAIEEMMFMSSSEGIINWTTFQNIRFSVPSDSEGWTALVDDDADYIPWHCVIVGAPPTRVMKSVSSPLYCGRLVNFFYNPGEFHIILGLAASIIIGWNIMGVVFLLIKRALELAILFMISPIAISLYPLDDGAATAAWRKSWQGRILAPTTIVFAYNIFFSLIALLNADNLALPGIFRLKGAGIINPIAILFNLFWDVVIVMCMSSLLKSASKLICEVVGAEDLIGNSSAMMDKAVKTAVSAATVVATGGAAVGKLAQNVARGGKGSARDKMREDRKAKLEAGEDELAGLKTQLARTSDPTERASLDAKITAKEAEMQKLKDSKKLFSGREARRELVKEQKKNIKLEELQKYDSDLTMDDIENKSARFQKAQEKYKNDKPARQKERENVYKSIVGYATFALPKENEAVKFAGQMADHKERRKLYMTSWDVGKAEKKEAEEKQKIDQEKAYNIERNLKKKEAEKEKERENKKTEADREALAYSAALKKDGGTAGANVAELQAKIEKANLSTATQADKDDLKNLYDSLGVNDVFNDLDSVSKYLRDSARKQLEAAKAEQEKGATAAATMKNLEEMLPRLQVQLQSISGTADYRGLSPIIQQAIEAARKETNGKQGFRKFDPQTQKILESIMACQGGLSDVAKLLETLKTLSITGFKELDDLK